MKKDHSKESKNKKGSSLKISDMMPKELLDETKRLRLEISKAQVEKFGGKEKNVKKRFNFRKRLARVLTELTKKAILSK